MESAERVSIERLFQIMGAATEKDRAAIAVLVTGTTRREVSTEDLSVHAGSGFWRSSDKYEGVPEFKAV